MPRRGTVWVIDRAASLYLGLGRSFRARASRGTIIALQERLPTMPKARKFTRRTLPSPSAPIVPAVATDRLLGDIRSLIEAAREQTARAVNSALVGLCWHIGKRIRQDVLHHKRAGYGEQIVSRWRRN